MNGDLRTGGFRGQDMDTHMDTIFGACSVRSGKLPLLPFKIGALFVQLTSWIACWSSWSLSLAKITHSNGSSTLKERHKGKIHRSLLPESRAAIGENLICRLSTSVLWKRSMKAVHENSSWKRKQIKQLHLAVWNSQWIHSEFHYVDGPGEHSLSQVRNVLKLKANYLNAFCCALIQPPVPG